MIGVNLTEDQQCLLDNLWHIQTVPQASSFKVQILNALSFYFHKQSSLTPEKQIKKFTHYVIIRGTKVGIFNNWATVIKYIECQNPLYKGCCSFQEAMNIAREHFGLNSFFIEPEQVKTFSEIAKTSAEQMIKAQEEIIAKLQQQLMQSGKDTRYIQSQIENNILKQKIKILEAKNVQLIQRNEKKDEKLKTAIYRNYECFKARILDLPWRQTLRPVLDQFKEFEQMVSQKICIEFPAILYELQQKIVQIAFQEINYKGVTLLQFGCFSPRNLPCKFTLLDFNSCSYYVYGLTVNPEKTAVPLRVSKKKLHREHTVGIVSLCSRRYRIDIVVHLLHTLKVCRHRICCNRPSPTPPQEVFTHQLTRFSWK
ncbi:unnamed protein product [Lactuca virosa]|uniref:Uncharacterized protein n=1 Tax=Lactuca virosa TaxID=75947 RepID=A0AAU9P2C1_9ASTR|nr:unnamed protein product [Lactuca virosa]